MITPFSLISYSLPDLLLFYQLLYLNGYMLAILVAEATTGAPLLCAE